MKIRVLPDIVVNQIAAGEVVDRPVSVVRELVDNSLDAGANEIIVTLEQGGRTRIRVTDNGNGMVRDDALLAFERHATSKIGSAEDLHQITTMGFRGEALAAIAAVSRVTLISRPPDITVGTMVRIEGGVIREVQSQAAPLGTDITVDQLFYNLPARRKFLRQPATEQDRVVTWLQHASIAWPHGALRVRCDGREVLSLPPRATSLERARDLMEGTFVEINERIRCSDGEGHLAALLGHPALAASRHGGLVLLVNRRMVSDRMIVRAVKEGFRSTLKERELPVGFVMIDIPPASVDVNVHPQKSEVRFREPQALFGAVSSAVAQGVNRFSSPVTAHSLSSTRTDEPRATPLHVVPRGGPSVLADVPRFLDQSRFEFQENAARALSPSLVPDSSQPGADDPQKPEALPKPAPFRFSDLRYIGQALECYLLCEWQGRLVVVDMHAAHERYNYNVIRNRAHLQQRPQQQLLTPVHVPLTAHDSDHLLAHREVLARFGFEIEEFGHRGTGIVVRAAPPEISGAMLIPLMKELASYRFDGGDDASSPQPLLEKHVDALCARLACHASMRSGHQISRDEVYSLFALLDKSEFSAACPHGRPVVVEFAERDIERWFGRDR